MKFIDEFRDPAAARGWVRALHDVASRCGEVTFMEVCGTHTMSIYRHGIRRLLPDNVKLLSGPGCPVCVTPNGYMDHAIALARQPGFVITTFGDMVRVPGSSSSLQNERARGADVRVVYSTLDALAVAKKMPERQVVFLGVGFETTSPTVAAALLEAERDGLTNFSVLEAGKVIPPAMEALVSDGQLRLSGFLCPGHVSMVIGSDAYQPLARRSGLPCVVGGFEALDVLQAIVMLVQQVADRRAEVEVAYRRVVSAQGNAAARAIMDEVFEVVDTEWRGIGTIPGSGLAIRPRYGAHDAARFDVAIEPLREHPGCACGEILRGLKSPFDCRLFASACTPDTPVGACMVSTEGTCAAAYRYGRNEDG